MTPPDEAVVAPIARARTHVLADLVALAKPRVVLMVVVTTVVGYYAGLAGAADWRRIAHLVLGTALAAGGSFALNQHWERDLDARMTRTRLRPLPDGRLQPGEALAAGIAGTAVGLLYLLAMLGPLVAGVTALTFVLYVFAYTPLKVRTPLCTIVGAVPGALPPVTGWVAARGEAGLGAWVLFGILFLWQLPHTLAIGRLYRDDYARAGVRVLPVVDGDGGMTERQIVMGCLALLLVSLFPTLIGLAGVTYFAGALVFGMLFVGLGAWHAAVPSPAGARRVLFASLLYLPALLALLALDKG